MRAVLPGRGTGRRTLAARYRYADVLRSPGAMIADLCQSRS